MRKRTLTAAWPMALLVMVVACNTPTVDNPDDEPSDQTASDEGADEQNTDGDDTASGLRWFSTCGDPVCSGHTPNPDIAACTTETAGAGCTPDGALCDPGNNCNSYLVCAASDPKQRPGGCPISSARFKRDIEYLGEAEREKLREALLRIPLATYGYRSEPADAPRHLGFIIEDVGRSSPAVDPSRDMVELYGYLSMAVATIQAQEAQIRALESRIEALETARAREP